LTGKVVIFTPGALVANACNTIFPASGTSVIASSAPVWKVSWSVPQTQNQQGANKHNAHWLTRRNGNGNDNSQGNGATFAPTYVSVTTLSVTNASGLISFGASGQLTVSFSSPSSGTVNLGGSPASWSYNVIKAVCATTVGLRRLILGTGVTDSL
jgi:hypothetical protein